MTHVSDEVLADLRVRLAKAVQLRGRRRGVIFYEAKPSGVPVWILASHTDNREFFVSAVKEDEPGVVYESYVHVPSLRWGMSMPQALALIVETVEAAKRRK